MAQERYLSGLMMACLLLAGLLGGGQTSAQVTMFVELPACLLAALGIAGIVDGRYPRSALPAILFVVLICLVPIAQIVPLPAGWWQSLPGREVPSATVRIAGVGGIARPISLTPQETVMAAMALAVPAAIFITALQLSAPARDRLIGFVVAFAAISAIFGVFQVTQGGLDIGVYEGAIHEGYPIGFFANRNHEADLLLIAIPWSVLLVREQVRDIGIQRIIAIGACLFFSLSVVFTQSRTGVSLLPLALGGAAAIWVGDVRDRRFWLSALSLIAAMLVAYLIVRLTPIGARLMHRFDSVGDDMRPVIWQTSWVAIKDFWPIGSGLGSFPPVYNMYEDLDWVGTAWVNHAHDDYLEILIDTGIAGAVLLLAYAALLLSALRGRPSQPLRRQKYAGIAAILILLTHSLTDYPLRTFLLIGVFALANALVFPARVPRRANSRGSHPVAPQPNFIAEYSHA